jgi:hypothetical protein
MNANRYYPAVYMGAAPTVREAVEFALRGALPAEQAAAIGARAEAEWAGRPLLIRDLEPQGAILALTPPQQGEAGACGTFYLFGEGFDDAADAQELACDMSDESHAGDGPFGTNPWAVYRVEAAA